MVLLSIKVISFSHRHLPHISFYFYQRGTGPKYGSGVPCLPLKKRVLIDEHVHEKVFNDRIAELLALFVIKESALYFEGLLLF
jgi:hypothetical protein